ncbi:hypothetical protein DAPPUDRAFT_333407 [Daphnia pulex]|uniref:Uncharacterized protein n=1 Tax=Daphnia pulex TaxID=6669 RepID=E9HSQ8_DAPPU|nr:hypothetical protein DAPPUDRAFT_333407 [Daphnia pulex]|eukprot:EFX65203.1 hypothetical protein DAPPUDRAFT_333407 [Daphnia pulex]
MSRAGGFQGRCLVTFLGCLAADSENRRGCLGRYSLQLTLTVSPNSTDDGSQKGDGIGLCSPVEDYPTEDSSHIPYIAQDPDLCSPVEDYPASHIPCIAQDSVTIGADLCSPVEVTPPIPDDLPLSTVSRTASILGPRSRRPPVRWADESLT